MCLFSVLLMGEAHLASARRLRAHLPVDYLERDAFRFLAPKITPAIVNNLLRRPRAAFYVMPLQLCLALYAIKVRAAKTLLEGIYGTSSVRFSTATSASGLPQRRRPLSVTVLSQKLRLLQTSSLRGRHDLHQMPELGNNLPQTSAYIQARLDEMDIPIPRSSMVPALWALSAPVPPRPRAMASARTNRPVRSLCCAATGCAARCRGIGRAFRFHQRLHACLRPRYARDGPARCGSLAQGPRGRACVEAPTPR